MPAPLSLLEELARIPDPRNRRGTRHPLPAILSLTVLAMLTGCNSYTAIAQFGRDKGAALAFALGFRRGKTPAKSRLSTLFRRLNVTAFEAALSRWGAARLGTADGLHISHYRRDVTLGEDQSRVRKGSAPQILAGLRNSIIHLVQDVAPGLATAIRRLGNCFSQALDLLGLPQLE